MTLDIAEGDILVYGGQEYPVRAVGEWKWYGPASLSMRRLCRETCSTKRLPAISGGKRGAAVTKLTNVACTPLDPATVDITAEVLRADPRKEQLLASLSLRETTIGDSGRYLRVIVEDVK